MGRGRVRRWAKAIPLAAAAIWVLLPVAVPSLVIRSEEYLAREARRLGQRIAEKDGVVFLVTFDEPAVRDWISGWSGLAPGTESVPARTGRGRLFDGRPRTYVETPARWGRVGDDYTVSLWVKLNRASRTQDIMFRSGDTRQTGFRLEDGVLKFDVPARDGLYPSLECPFANYDEFAHLAAVVSRSAGRAILYLNGERRAEGVVRDVAMPGVPIEFGTRQWWAVRHPLHGIIDEAVIWNRSLDPEEILHLYQGRRGILRHLSTRGDFYRWQTARLLAAAVRGSARISDAVFDLAGSLISRGRRKSLDRLVLYLSASDRRFFAAAHRESRRSGRRTDRAADVREIHFGWRGRVRKGRLQLHGSDTAYYDNPRPAYILETADGEPVLGSGRLLLCPPEDVSFLLPLMESELAAVLGTPGVANGLVNLAANNRSQGIYYYEDREKLGITPGDFAELFAGPRHRNDWAAIFRWMQPYLARRPPDYRQPDFADVPRRRTHRRLPLAESSLREIFELVSRRYRAVLINDPASSLTRPERVHRLGADRERLAEIWPTAPVEWTAARKAADFLSEYLVIGGNPSPDRITEDLDLSGLRLPGVSIRWTSSRAGIISDDGRVNRPPGSRPDAVRLTAEIDDGGEPIRKTLAFRVMPERVEIPSLIIYSREPVQKARRVDARIDYYPPGESSRPRTLWATRRERGGISHRGNTGYWRPKKLFSLRTDTPHRLLGDGETRHLQFVNPRTDPSFIRNRLSYDIFRAFGSDRGRRYAPRVAWAEVFLNGVYQGLHELSERIDERMLGWEDSPTAAGPPPVIYKQEIVPPRIPDMRQKRPSRRRGLFMQPYLELDDFLTRASTKEFAADFTRYFDLENAVDFHLLLNLTQNLNGYPFSYPTHDNLVRGGGPGARFFIVPWDFDNTFGHRWGWRWLNNGMQQRLQDEFPGYRDRLRERWAELRRDVLDEDRLVESINSHADRLRGYAQWDYNRWNYLRGYTYDDTVKHLISLLRKNLRQMDEFLKPGQSPEPD